MTGASKILDKILPEKNEICYHQTINQKQLCLVCQAENELIDEIRQEMVDTYGKEWVVVPDKETLKNELCQINFEGNPEWLLFVNKEIVNSKHKSLEDMLEMLAESILKGLRGK